MNVRKSIIFTICTIFLSGFLISIYTPCKQYLFFSTPLTSTIEDSTNDEINNFYTTSLFRKVHYGKKQNAKFIVFHHGESTILSNEYNVMSKEFISEEQMKTLIPIHCEKDLTFVKKNLTKLKKYEILNMKLEKNYQWSVEILYEQKKIKIIFPFGNINNIYLEKLQKYYKILNNFSYIEILGENSIIAAKN